MHVMDFLNAEPIAQSWVQFGELGLAFILSSIIGLEREFRAKSAGLRTHTLVGVAAALIMLVSKYGFGDTIVKSSVVLDPSRVAAQIVSGIGFIGGGLIFVQRDVVRGLTTAAIIWLTAAVGMACGAGLPLLALFVTGAHFLVIYVLAPLAQRALSESAALEIRYLRGRGRSSSSYSAAPAGHSRARIAPRGRKGRALPRNRGPCISICGDGGASTFWPSRSAIFR